MTPVAILLFDIVVALLLLATIFFYGVVYYVRRYNKVIRKTIGDYKQQLLIKQGQEQFKKLTANNLRIPIAIS